MDDNIIEEIKVKVNQFVYTFQITNNGVSWLTHRIIKVLPTINSEPSNHASSTVYRTLAPVPPPPKNVVVFCGQTFIPFNKICMIEMEENIYSDNQLITTCIVESNFPQWATQTECKFKFHLDNGTEKQIHFPIRLDKAAMLYEQMLLCMSFKTT